MASTANPGPQALQVDNFAASDQFMFTQAAADRLEQQIAALGGLPPTAQPIQAACTGLILPMLAQTRALQQARSAA